MAQRGIRDRMFGPAIMKSDPLRSAFPAITAMETQVCYRTVTAAGYTVQDVMEWLWPPDVIEKLQAAYPHALAGWRSSYEGSVHSSALSADIHFNTESVGMLVPKTKSIISRETTAAPKIIASINAIKVVEEKFGKVHKVVRWFNQNASLGAIKYYFPSVCALLPKGHPIHTLDSYRLQEPLRPIAEIAEDTREAMTIIAMGLLAGATEIPKTGVFGVKTAHGATIWLPALEGINEDVARI